MTRHQAEAFRDDESGGWGWQCLTCDAETYTPSMADAERGADEHNERGDTMTNDYEARYRAMNDGLWLVQRGAKNPEPPAPDSPTSAGLSSSHFYEPSYATTINSPGAPAPDPRYAEISLALDIARFLLAEEQAAEVPLDA